MALHLILKYKWYNMIDAGVKFEEYREIKPYYRKLENLRKGDMIVFRKGYSNTFICAEVVYCYQGYGIRSWGGNPDKLQWVIGFRVIYKSK